MINSRGGGSRNPAARRLAGALLALTFLAPLSAAAQTADLVLSKTEVTTGEDGTTATFTVRLNKSVTSGVDVDISVDDSTEASVAYTSTPRLSATRVRFWRANAGAPFNLRAWNNPAVVTVTGLDDAIADGDQPYVITLRTGGPNAEFAGITRTVSGTNRDNEPGLAVSESSVSTTEGMTDTFTVQLNTVPTAPVTVTFASSDTDEATVSPSRITFGATAMPSASPPVVKWDAAQTVTVTGADDAVDEDAQPYTITLSSTSSDTDYNSLSRTVSGTNADDDDPPTVGIGSASVLEGDSGQTNLNFTVSLSAASGKQVTVKYAVDSTDGGTAISGTDYTEVTETTLTFAAGETSKTASVSVTGDQIEESDETVRLTLSDPVNATLDPAKTTGTGTITDDDGMGLTVSKTTVSTTEASGAGRTDDFTVRLGSAPSATVTVTISSSDTDEATVSPGTLRFAAAQDLTTDSANPVYKWDDPRTVTVTGVDDMTPEVTQSYTITVSSTSSDTNYNGLSKTVSGTNADNDAPVVTLALGSAMIDESGVENSTTVSATLSATSTATTTVRVTVSATGGYTVPPSANTITIAAGMTTSTDRVTITAADNDIDAADLSTTVTATATNTSALGVTQPAAVSLRIEDDDTAGLTASKSAVSTTEVSGARRTDSFTVELDSEPTAAVTVAVGVTGGDTDEASVNPTSIVFGATAMPSANPRVYEWDDPQTVTVTGVDDNVDDGDRTYTVTLNPDSAAGMSGDAKYRDDVMTESVSGTNADDDTAGLTLSKTTVSTSEASGAARTDEFTVALATEPTAMVTVAIASSDTDEATVSPSSLRFAAAADSSDPSNPVYRWNDARTVTVTGVDDSVDEDDKTYTITVNPDSAAGLLGDAKYRDDVATETVSGTNADDDDEPTVGIDSPSAPEGNSGETDLTFTVSLSAASGRQVTVNYALDSIDGGTATARTDYVAPAAGMLTFAAGETRKTVPVRVRGDTTEEPDETVRLTLSDPVNATLDPAKTTGTGTIRDDDGMELTVSKTAVSTSEPAGTDDFTVRLAAEPTAAVTVTIGVTGGDTDEATVSPSSIRFGARAMPGASPPVYRWDDPRTVTVTGADDDVDDDDRSYAITLSTSSPDAGYDNLLQTVSGTNADDDTAGLTTSKSMVLTGEDESTDTFTVRLASQPTAAVTVTVAVGGTDPDEATANPGTLLFSTANWDTPQTVTLTGVDDSMMDGERPYAVTLTAASADAGYSGLSASVEGRNGDNEGAALWVSRTAVTTTEASGTGRTDDFTVRLATAPTAAVTVTVAVGGTDPDEATVNPGTLTFSTVNWGTPQTVTVTGADDSIDDDDRSYTITVSSASMDTNYNGLSQTVSGTNVDDEAAPTVTLSLSRTEIKEAAGAQASERRATVTARLSHATKEATTVTVSATEGANAARDDFALSGTTLTIDAGETSSADADTAAHRQVTITAVDDRVDSLVKTDAQGNAITAKLVTVSGSVTGGNGASAPSSATLRIAEDDLRGLVFTPALPQASRRCARLRPPPGCPSLIYRTVNESGAGTTATFQVKLATQPTSAVSVAVSSQDEGEGLVSQSGDAAPARTTTLSFRTGNWDTPQTVTLTGVDDDAVDGDQDYLVLLNPNAAATDAYSLAPRVRAQMQTTDTSTAGLTLSETSVSTSEASGTARTDDFTVRLDTIPSATVTVTVASNDAGEAGASPSRIKFGATADADNNIFAWNDPQTVTVTGADDDVQDGSQTYTITASSSSSDTNYSSLSATVSGTNADDDDAALTVSKTSVSTSEDGAPAMPGDPDGRDTFTVRLATEPTAQVTVTITSSDLDEATASPGTLTFAAAAMPSASPPVYKWDDARTVTVTGVDDANPEAAQSYTITVAATSPGSGGDAIYHSNTEVPDVAVLGTNADNDAPTVTLALSANSISEDGGTSQVSASLNRMSTHDTTVRVTVSATGGYTVGSPDTITIAANATTSTDRVTITAVDNDIDAADLSTTVTATATNTSALGVAQPAAVSLTITDEDTAGLTASKSAVSTTEASGAGRTDSFTVALDTEPTATVTVAVGVTGGDTDEASVSPSSIVFGATAMPSANPRVYEWDDPQTVTVTGADDDVDDDDRSYTVTLNPDSAAGMSGDAKYRDDVMTASVSGTNADDDTAALTVSKTSVSTSEDGAPVMPGDPDGRDTFTVRLATEPTAQVTVTITSSNTDEATVSPGTLTFAAAADTSDSNNPVYKWDDPRTVTVTGVDDSAAGANPDYTITLNPDSATGMSGDANYRDNAATASVSGTNADNDAPVVSLALSPASIAENDGTSQVSATLSESSTHATTVTVMVSTTGGYTVGTPNTITIAAGSTSSTDRVTITAADNDIDAPNLSTTVTATADNAPAALRVSNPAAVSLTITDDDAAPTVTLALSDASINEAGGTTNVLATLSHRSSQATTVTVTAVAGHYTVPSMASARVITIAAGMTTSADRVTITAVDDPADTADRTGTVTASAANTQGVGTVIGATLTLEDGDAAPTVSLTLNDASIAENGGTAAVSATLSHRSSAATTVTVTAVSGFYTVGSPSTITIDAGETTDTDTVTITAADNMRDEPNRSAAITGTATNSRGVGTVSGATLALEDDDAAPGVELTLASGTIAESGAENSTTVSAALTGGTTSSAATTVTVTVSATGGYTVPSAANTITIAAGASSGSGTVTITAEDNSVDAADLTTTVTGTAANTQGIASTTATAADLTITDDDTAALTLSKTSVTTSEDGAPASAGDPDGRDTFTVRLATKPTAEVTVAISSDTPTEATVSPPSLTFTPSTQATLWSTPQTVTVTGVDDMPPAQDGAKTYTITLDPDSAAGMAGDANYRDNAATVPVSGINRDNEAPTVTLSLSPGAISENGGTATLTASLDGDGVPEATVVTVSAAPGAAAGGFRLSGTTLRIPVNATASENSLTITAVNNRVDAPDKTVTLSGSADGGQGAADPSDVTLTIEDDEGAPTVTLAAASAAIWEDGGTTTVSARLSHASSAETRVTVRGVAGLYEVVGRATILIPAGALTGASTVMIRALDNTERAAADRTAVIAGAASNTHSERDGGTTTVAAARVTVWDDETASVSLLLEPERVAEGGMARVSARLTRPARAAVTLTVSAAAGTNATAASFALGPARTLTVPAGATASTGAVEIEAADDEVDAPDREVTVSAAVASSVRARTPEAVTLTIEDDDEAPQAMLILTPAIIDESGETNAAAVSATLSHPSSAATTIAVSAAGAGFVQRGTTLTIPALGTASAAAVTLTAVDDEMHREDREVTVSGRAENAQGVEQPAAVVLTIRDDDGTEEVTAALLPEAARALADSRAAAVRQRLERAGSAGASELPTLTGLLERHGPSAQEDGLEWKKTLLPQASFLLPLDDGGNGGGGGIAAWGGGDYRDLDGEAGGVKWDGGVASAHLGADRLLANGLRLGLAASWSEAKFDYEHRARKGEWTLAMTSAQPYLGWTTAGGAALWASAGYGSGELEIAPENGRRETADADMRMAAAGASAPLHAADGLEVSLRGEALYAAFAVDGNGAGIAAHDSDVSRLRLAVEARRERTLESGAVVSPRLELGARHDGGDGETGAGAELGVGLGYASGRLSAAFGARALAANSNYDEWGADLSLAYAAAADGRGLTFRLAPAWGAAGSGTAELWEQGAPGLDGAAAEPEAGGRMEAELGYGLKSPLSRGLLTLAAGGEWGEDAGSVCRLTGTVALDATSTLGLELELRRPQSGATERSLMLKGELRF